MVASDALRKAVSRRLLAFVLVLVAVACAHDPTQPNQNTPTAPSAPSALAATPSSTTQINLAWTDNSNNEDGFRIERAPGGTTTFAEITTVGAGVATYQNAGLTSSTAYIYRVRAYNTTGNSDYSATATATTQLAPPGAPSNLLASGASSSQVNLVWTDNSSNEDGFKIERSTTGTTGLTEIATVGAGVTTYQNTGLAASSGYTYRVRSYNAAGNSGYTNFAAGFTSAAPAAPPAAPTGLAATALSPTQIDLSWTDNSNNEESFRVERAPGGTTTFGEIASVAAGVTTYHNTGLAASTDYTYRVRARNTAGNSAYTSTVDATTPSVPSPPAEPSALTATAVSSTQINLAWTDNSTDEDGFRIERAPGGTTTFAEITTVGASVTTYQNTSLAASTAYTYRVRAYNANGTSDYSATASATTQALAAPPVAPSGLTATAASAAQINLSWTDNSNNEDGFKVERAPGATTSWAEVGTVGLGVTTYQSTALAASTPYDYRVRAYNATGNSVYSATATATTTAAAVTPPSAPSTLVATTASSSQINLTWTDNSTDEDVFRIERSPAGMGSFAEIAFVAAGITSYQNTALTGSTAFDYRVYAHNAAGNSAYTATATATTLPNPPEAPSGLKAGAVSTSRIDLKWVDNSKGEDGFKIERSSGESPRFEEIATVGKDVTSFANGKLLSGTYTYRVRAYNAGGNSGYTKAATVATLPPAPVAPSGLLATPVSPTEIDLSWTDNSGNEDGFQVERAVDDTGTFLPLTSVAAGVTSYQDLGVGTGVPYAYRLRAYNAGGYSAYSNTGTATAQPNPPAAPSDLAATAVSSSQINLSWTDNSDDENGFYIERAPGGTTSFVEITSVGPGITSYQNLGLTASTAYSYRVKAANFGGSSAYSATATATTQAPSLPAAPSNPTATTATSAGQINLAWTDNSANEDGFKVERAPGGTTSFVEITTVGAGVTTYQNTALIAATTYTYRVRAYNAGGNSSYSGIAIATTLPLPPVAPTGLTATVISSTQISLAWVDNSLNEDGFAIERAPGGSGSFVQIGTVAAGITQAQNTSLPANTSFSYRVRAYNTGGNSTYSNTVTITTTLTPPAAPSNLTAVGTSPTQISISWVDNSLNEDAFHVEQSTNGAAYVDISVVPSIGLNGVPAGTTDVNVTGLSAGSTYTYRVRARNSAGYSGYTNTTAPATPTTPSQITVYPSADNSVINFTKDASKANTVYQTGENVVGCNFVLEQFALAYFCTASAFQFSNLQQQIAGRTIASAVFRLYPSSLAPNSTVYAVNAISQSWNPATLTWNTNLHWYGTPQSNLTRPTNGNAFDFNVTAMVQAWANGTYVNNGIMLHDLTVYPGTSAVELTGFWSADYYSNTALRPQLIITFQ